MTAAVLLSGHFLSGLMGLLFSRSTINPSFFLLCNCKFSFAGLPFSDFAHPVIPPPVSFLFPSGWESFVQVSAFLVWQAGYAWLYQDSFFFFPSFFSLLLPLSLSLVWTTVVLSYVLLCSPPAYLFCYLFAPLFFPPCSGFCLQTRLTPAFSLLHPLWPSNF